MRNLIFLFLLVALGGCSSEDPSIKGGKGGNLIGSWRFQGFNNTIEVDDDAERKEFERWMNDAQGFTGGQFNFQSDGTFRLTFNGSGTFTTANGILQLCFNVEEDCETPTPYSVEGDTFTMIIDHTARERERLPNAGIRSLIERRIYVRVK